MIINYQQTNKNLILNYSYNNTILSKSINIEDSQNNFDYKLYKRKGEFKFLNLFANKVIRSTLSDFRLFEIVKSLNIEHSPPTNYCYLHISKHNQYNEYTVEITVPQQLVLVLTTSENYQSNYSTVLNFKTKVFLNKNSLIHGVSQILSRFNSIVVTNETLSFLTKFGLNNKFVINYSQIIDFFNIKHNSNNTIEINNIESEYHLLKTYFNIVKLSHCTYEKSFYATETTKHLIFDELLKNDYKLPYDLKINNTNEPVKGGYIYLKDKTLYNNVMVLDFKSWYPSLAQTFNIPFYRNNDDNNILKNIFEKLSNIRNNSIDKIENESIKLLQNKIYGCFNNSNFYFKDNHIANLFTSNGRDLIQLLKNEINNHFKCDYNKYQELLSLNGYNIKIPKINSDLVVYVHTDSLIINWEPLINNNKILSKFCFDEILQPFIKKCISNYLKSNDIKNNYLNLQLESQYDSVLFLAKNKYIIVNDNKLFSVGKIIKHDTYNDKIFNQLLLNYLINRNIESLFSQVKTMFELYKIQPINKISNRDYIKSYTNYVIDDKKAIKVLKTSNTLITGAALYNYVVQNKKLDKRLINNNCEVGYYFIKGNKNVFCFPISETLDFKIPEFDYRRMYEENIINPLNKILNKLNISPINIFL